MRILFCGDREWDDSEMILDQLRFLSPLDDTIIHGNARGADTIAGYMAEELNFPVEVYPADWEKYGRSAGPIRNKQMLDSGLDLVHAFHFNLSGSKGTKNMVLIALKAKVPVFLNDVRVRLNTV